MRHYFITSTGTGIGKTYITAVLISQARRSGKTVAAFKPMVSGFDPQNNDDSDPAMILSALGLSATPANIDLISPWRYVAPLAPPMAARLESRAIDHEAVIAHSRNLASGAEEIILIEGVGGVMAPISDNATNLDWIEHTGLPVLLVVGSYLGTLSHSLTALEALRARHVTVAAIIMNESEQAEVPLQDNAAELRRWSRDSPVITVPRHGIGEELRSLL
jgi:dethiobiotin synthetase